MKTFLFSFFFYIFCISGATANSIDTVIDNPDYDFTRTEKFMISKIELSATATKVHLEWDLPEGWWIKYEKDIFLRNPETGKKFAIISVENEEFDAKITIDSSETHHSVLTFPPLEKGIEKIDYNDQFFGLYLKGKKPEKSSELPEAVVKWMNEELDKVKKEPLQDYETEKFFSKEPAKIIGYIKGYGPKAGFETGIYYASNQLTREDYPVTIEIHKDGSFEADIPLIHPVKSSLIFNKRWMEFYLEPGQTLGMVLNWKDFLKAEHYNNRSYPQKSIEFKGKLAEINKELSQFQFPRFDYDEYKKNQLNLSAQDFKEYAFNFQEENKKRLDSFIAHNVISDNAELILRNENKLSGVIMVMNYLLDRDYHQKQNPENEFLKEKIETDYYEFLKDLPLNKKSLLVNKDFSQFINRFEYADPIRFVADPKGISPEISLLEYFDLQKIPLTEKERNMYKPRSFESMEEYQDFEEKRKPFDEKYSEELEAYRKKYIEPLPKSIPIDFMEPWHKKDSVMANHLHLKNDLAYDITKTRSLKSTIGRITEADQAYEFWDELSETIENDFLREEGERIIQSKFPKKAKDIDGVNNPSVAVKSKTIPLPEGKAKDLFYDIASQYKGKILFIDFWATSCGPCVATIKSMKETRKKYEDNPDFEFVFITDEAQSPIKAYTNFTKEQEMKNLHRVDTDIYNRFRQLFRFNGIPRYVVLNKQGELIDGDFPMHNFNYEMPRILKNNP